MFVQDILDVLKALNIKSVNIYATSYGTRLALELARLHPNVIRTMTLEGVVPPGLIMTQDFSRDAYRTLENVASKEEIHQIDEILKQPIVRVGKEEVSSGVLSEAIRDMLYTPESARRLRTVVANASRGDYSDLAPYSVRCAKNGRALWQSASFFRRRALRTYRS